MINHPFSKSNKKFVLILILLLIIALNTLVLLRLFVNPVCGECQYLKNRQCINYDCCEDKDCDDSDFSTKDVCSGMPKKCSNTKITQCISGDNYCPPECNYKNDKDCEQINCGNKIIEKDEQCDDGNLNENDICKNDCRYNLDYEIPVSQGFPPGGVSYINWEFEDDFEQLDVDVNILSFDTSKYFYLQFYQSMVGDAGFYFGIQNRVDENDQILIFSRWGTRDLSNVEVNVAEEGFSQSAGYEGDFVGVRLPNFKLKNGEYTFSLIKDREDNIGIWYKYIVTEKSTNKKTWGGSIRFDKGAKINRLGSTWTELYGARWPIQTYSYLPKWDFEIKSIEGDGKSPLHATSIYSDPNWGDHIPMEEIYYDPSKNIVSVKLGPDVVRRHNAGRLY